MNSIHPTAVIEPGAEIGEDVSIGAYSVIGPKVKLGRSCQIASHVVIAGHTSIGDETIVFQFASVGAPPQDLKFKGEDSLAIIGDNTMIRECVTVNRGTASKGRTVVGSNCLLMAYSHIAHDCVLNDSIIVGNATQLAGEVEVDHHAILSGGTLVHQFSRIGAHVMIQGGTRLGKDIPPYVIAGREPVCYSGLNLVGLRRSGFSNEKINEIQEIYRTIYQAGFNFTDAVNKIEKEFEETPEMRLIVDFIKNSPRGIVRGYMG